MPWCSACHAHVSCVARVARGSKSNENSFSFFETKVEKGIAMYWFLNLCISCDVKMRNEIAIDSSRPGGVGASGAGNRRRALKVSRGPTGALPGTAFAKRPHMSANLYFWAACRCNAKTSPCPFSRSQTSTLSRASVAAPVSPRERGGLRAGRLNRALRNSIGRCALNRPMYASKRREGTPPRQARWHVEMKTTRERAPCATLMP